MTPPTGSSRKAETALAYFTLVFVAIFAPIETIVSWRFGLLNPYYLVDLIAIVILFAGVIRSLRARPHPAPAIMTVGWAWAGANFWRAGLARYEEVKRGGALMFGARELTAVVATTGLAMVCMVIGIVLIVRSRDA